MNSPSDLILINIVLIAAWLSAVICRRYWNRVWRHRLSVAQERGLSTLIAILAPAQFVLVGGALGAFKQPSTFHPGMYVSIGLAGFGWLFGASVFLGTFKSRK